MKKRHSIVLLSAAAFLLASSGLQPARAGSDLEEKYEKKISKPFVAFGGWGVDYDAALARAEKEKKFIFAYFTRSYAR